MARPFQSIVVVRLIILSNAKNPCILSEVPIVLQDEIQRFSQGSNGVWRLLGGLPVCLFFLLGDLLGGLLAGTHEREEDHIADRRGVG